MARKLINYRIKGMQQDMAPSVHNAEFSFENKNIRITSRDNNTFLAIENERGNAEILFTEAVTYGVCWSTTPEPTISDNKTINGKGVGSFTSQITDLLPGTVYYVRSYATNSVGTTYGNEFSFTTLANLPSLLTTSVRNISYTTATGGGNVISDGGATVTDRGICWSTSPNPTIANNKTTDGGGIGSFTSSITNLQPGKTYYVRAYATNSAGTAYGEQRIVTTLMDSLPTVTTTTISSITVSTASSGGNISYDGGASVTARGVCWSTAQNPTVSLSTKTTNGAGTGSFTSNITGLTANTTYYVRAYATNAVGTAYGNEVSFSTDDGQERITLGTPSDLTYVSVKIPILVEEGSGALQSPVGGVCWNTTGNPTTADNTLEMFDDYGSFVAEITGLTSGTTYYFRGYATTEIGTTYTSQIEIETPTGILEVETLDIDLDYVGDTWAQVRGTVNDPTESGVIEFGICYSLYNTTPTIEDSVVVVPGSPDLFTGVITGLITDMGSYFARAYAVNLSGVYYGSVKTFWTTR